MTEHHETVGEHARPGRYLLLSADRSFGEAVESALECHGGVVDRVSSRAEAGARLDDRSYDVLVVDHDERTLDAVSVVRDLRDGDTDVPIVVCGDGDAGALASDVLAAGAATFTVRDDPASVAETAASVSTGSHGGPDGTARSDVYTTVTEGVLASSEVGLIVSDASGAVRWASDVVGAFFDVPTDRIAGSSRRRLIRGRLATGVTTSSRLTDHLLSPDGDGGVLVRTDPIETARWLDCRSRSIESGPFAGGQVDRFVDVTRFVRSEDGLRELQQLMVAPDVTFAERLHEVLELGVERLGLPYGFVTAIDDGVQSVLDSVGDHDLLQPGESAPLLQTYCRKTLAAGSLVTIPDTPSAGWTNDPAYDLFERDSYVGAPIVIDGDTYGTLCFASSDPRVEFTDDEELFVEFAAAWAGWELERYGGTVS